MILLDVIELEQEIININICYYESSSIIFILCSNRNVYYISFTNNIEMILQKIQEKTLEVRLLNSNNKYIKMICDDHSNKEEEEEEDYEDDIYFITENYLIDMIECRKQSNESNDISDTKNQRKISHIIINF